MFFKNIYKAKPLLPSVEKQYLLSSSLILPLTISPSILKEQELPDPPFALTNPFFAVSLDASFDEFSSGLIR
jgi:hypothetical protein